MKKLFIFLFFLPHLASAQEIGEYTPPTDLPGGEDVNIPEILSQFSDVLLTVAGIIAVLMLVIGGIQYALSAGDDEKQAQAKRTFKWTMFGLILALVAYGVVELIVRVIG